MLLSKLRPIVFVPGIVLIVAMALYILFQNGASGLLRFGHVDDTKSTFQSGVLRLDASVSAVAFSPNEPIVAVGLSTGVIELRSVPDGAFIRRLIGHSSVVRAMAFSPDGKVLASGWGQERKLKDEALRAPGDPTDTPPWLVWSKDASIRLWRVSDGALLGTLAGDPFGVRALAFSPDGHTLASGGQDRRVLLWSQPDGHVLQALPPRPVAADGWADVMRIAYSTDGQTLIVAYGDNTVQQWSTRDNDLLREQQANTQEWGDNNMSDYVRSITLSHNGQMIATATYDDTVYVRQLSDGRVLHQLGHWDSWLGWSGHTDRICALAFSPNDEFIASGGCETVRDSLSLLQAPDMSVRIWRVADGTEITKLNEQKASVRGITWSPNGKLLIYGGDDGTIRLWEVK